MKRFFFILVTGVLSVYACSSSEGNEEEQKGPVTIRAQFINYERNGIESFRFRDDAGMPWAFDGYTGKEVQFSILLPEPFRTEANAGWGSNRELEGEWFELTFITETRESASGEEANEILIIESAQPLDEMEEGY